MSEIETVHPDLRVAEYAVKLEPDMFSQIFRRNRECLPVPAHAGLRVLVSYGLVAVAVARFSCKRKVHHPVVRQVHAFPSCGIELRRIRTLVVYGGRLGQIVEIFCSAAEVPGRRRGVTEGELPVSVEVDAFAAVLCSRSHDGQKAADGYKESFHGILCFLNESYSDAGRVGKGYFSVYDLHPVEKVIGYQKVAVQVGEIHRR